MRARHAKLAKRRWCHDHRPTTQRDEPRFQPQSDWPVPDKRKYCMDALSPRPSRRNSSDSRHYCRNQHCRSRLKEPTDNPRSAFCTRGCYASFYRSRCLVCERSTIVDPSTGQPRQRLDQRKFCGRRCKNEARRFPHLYADPFPPYGHRTDNSKNPHKTGPKTALQTASGASLPVNILGGYRWPGTKPLEPKLLATILNAEIGDNWLDWPPATEGAVP
jgi:hypothetical protein